MATPKQGYRLQDGARIPGTTTVVGRFKESGGLLQWAFQQGKAGKSSLYEDSKKACDVGTAAHGMIECHINGTPVDDALQGLEPELASKALNAFEQYLAWERQTKIKMLSRYQEIQLVSPEFQFGGTPDAIGEIDGQIVLIDWKTSNAVYQDYLLQLAAYAHLINYGLVMDKWEPLGVTLTGGFHLCRFSKDHPDFAHHYFGELDLAWQQFKLFREAYEHDKILKKRAA